MKKELNEAFKESFLFKSPDLIDIYINQYNYHPFLDYFWANKLIDETIIYIYEKYEVYPRINKADMKYFENLKIQDYFSTDSTCISMNSHKMDNECFYGDVINIYTALLSESDIFFTSFIKYINSTSNLSDIIKSDIIDIFIDIFEFRIILIGENVLEENQWDYYEQSYLYLITLLNDADLTIENNKLNIYRLYKNLGRIYQVKENYALSEKYYMKALKHAEDQNLLEYMQINYEVAELYAKIKKFRIAGRYIDTSINFFQKITKDYPIEDKISFVNENSQVIQLGSYIYNKLKMHERILVNADYFKSVALKEIINKNFDIGFDLLNVQKNLNKNESIIIYTNMKTDYLEEFSDTNLFKQPIVIYIDKNQIKSKTIDLNDSKIKKAFCVVLIIMI